MRKRKGLALFLAVAMVFCYMPGMAYADETAPAAATFADMPSDWSTEALKNAVDNGLISGYDGPDGTKLIKPTGSLTRAEMATIVNRAFGATETAALTGVGDVPADAWYAADMAKAVKMGTFKSDSQMRPNDSITRQEAFTVLARAFKVSEADSSALNSFADKGSIASWAANGISGLVKGGYVAGADGMLNPTASITRAEFAKIMDNMVKVYITKAETVKTVADGNVMVNVPGVTLDGVTINGNLIIGDGVGNGNVTLNNVKVTGETIVRGGGVNSIIIKGSSDVGNVVIAKVDGNVRVAVEGDAKVEVIYIDDGKDDVIVEGKVGTVEVAASDVPVKVQNAEVGEISVTAENADVTIAKDTTVTTVTVDKAAEKAGISVAGTVKNINVDAPKAAVTATDGAKIDNVTLGTGATGATTEAKKGATITSVAVKAEDATVKGDGTVKKVDVKADNASVDTKGSTVNVDKGVEGTTAGGKDVAGGGSTTTEGTTPSTGGGGGGGSTATVNTAVVRPAGPAGSTTNFDYADAYAKAGVAVTNATNKNSNTATITVTPANKTEVANEIKQEVSSVTHAYVGLQFNKPSNAVKASVTIDGTLAYTDLSLETDGASVYGGQFIEYFGIYDASNQILANDTWAVSITWKKADDTVLSTTTYTVNRVSILLDQTAPTGLVGVAPTTAGGSDGKITGTTTAMQYKLASAEDIAYATCGADETTALAAGDYVVRLAAKEGYNASPTTAVTVPGVDSDISSVTAIPGAALDALGWAGMPSHPSAMALEYPTVDSVGREVTATGSLAHVTGFTGFSTNTAEQSGYYLAFRIAISNEIYSIVNASTGTVMTLTGANVKTFTKDGLIEGTAGNYYIDVIMHRTAPNTNFTMTFDWDGTGTEYVGTTYTFNLSAVTAKTNITAIAAISGTPQVGETLTAGNVTPSGATVTYQWMICDTADGVYTDITSETTNTYTPVPSDEGKFIKVRAFGTGSYWDFAESAATTEVVAATADEAVAFSGLAANGTTGTVTTTELTITFDQAVTGLSADDFTVTGATKGALNETGGGVYTLAISDITVANGANVNVEVAKTGFAFTPADKDVTVYVEAAPVDITAASVTITAPVLGANPQDATAVETATSNADYTVTGLVWNEALTAGGKFKAAQAYTATVTLTSKNGKKFQDAAFTPTAAGSASVGTTTTSGSAVGNTVEFTVTYTETEALEVTGIEVATQPSKMNYTESSDDTLALNGMVVTETNNDGSTNEVTFTDGTAAGYTANPANGTTLTNAEHNGQPVAITHTASSKNANTGNLTVAEAAPVDITAASVTITAPVLGANPQDATAVETATSNADYTVTGLVWNEALTAGGKFKAAQAYTATVTLTSKNGKKFQDAAFTPTAAGSASVGTTTTSGSAVGNTVEFTVTYTETEALEVTGIEVATQPSKMNYTESSDDTLALNGMVVTETNNDGSTNEVTFTDGTAAGYTANPANGTTLTNAEHNGQPVAITHTASSKNANTGNLTVAEAAPVDITAASVTITAPVLGANPQDATAVETATSNADYTVTGLVWNEALTAGGKFKAAQAYTATVTLTSKNGKKFQDAAFTPTAAGSASVGTTTTSGSAVGNTVEFTVTYTETEALEVTGIEVTTQPSKMNYTESSDDTLALNGMVVTETNNDGSTNEVTFTDGTAAGYTANPANGTTLTNAEHNGQPVAITHTASSKNANTGNLTVDL